MRKASSKVSASSTVNAPSVIEAAGVQVVRLASTTDNPLIGGVRAGIELRAYFNAKGDARVAELVAYYQQ